MHVWPLCARICPLPLLPLTGPGRVHLLNVVDACERELDQIPRVHVQHAVAGKRSLPVDVDNSGIRDTGCKEGGGSVRAKERERFFRRTAQPGFRRTHLGGIAPVCWLPPACDRQAHVHRVRAMQGDELSR